MEIEKPQKAAVGHGAGSILSGAILALSGAAMTLLLSQGGSLLFIGGGVLLSLIVCTFVVFRYRLTTIVFHPFRPLPAILGAIIALSTAFLYRAEFAKTTNGVILAFINQSPLAALSGLVERALPTVVCILALYALFVWFYLFSNAAAAFVSRWVARSNRTERLFVLIGFLVSMVAVSVVYSQSNAFYGSSEPYDVVFTSDSSNLVKTNAFFYVNAYENDIRQPMFAVFSMPFAVVAMLLSRLLFFVPIAFPILLASIQALLLLFGFTLLSRVLRLTGIDQLLFLLLLAVSYPAMLFLFAAEQYVFSVFWILVLLYLWSEQSESRTMAYLAATGSLLTSGVFFPLLFAEKGVRNRICIFIKAMLAFVAVFIVFARVPMLNRALQTARDIASFTGDTVGFGTRAMQFFNFLESCFAPPAAGVDLTTFSHASYQLLAATSVNWFGVAILLIAAINTVLQWRDKAVRVSALWAGFSVLLLLVVGWGASENGMVLYTLYFFWAFAALLYTLVQRVVQRSPALRYAIVSAGIAALACVNILGMVDLIRFAITYYPIV